MKRIVLGLISIFLSILVFQNLTAHASVQDFVITDFQADYYLSKNNGNRSTLKTVEKITAQFPDIDQNHGIERALPTRYDNHSVKLNIVSVVDETGKKWSYSTYKSNDNLVLKIGDADTYVHGKKTYVITYDQQDVTKYYADSNADEFYWDVNGLDWKQPFGRVTARLHLDGALADSLTGGMYCYYGTSGSNKTCGIEKSQSYITASVSNLNIGENMTIAIGFKPGTFSPYDMSLLEWIQTNIFIIMLVANLFSLIIILIIRSTYGKDHPGRGAIVPEYLPPKGVNLVTAAIVSKNTAKWSAATYVDFAVRHNIKILQQSSKVWGFKKKSYEIEFISDAGLDNLEKRILTSLFGSKLQVGARYAVDKMKTDYKLSRSLSSIFASATKDADSNGYYKVNKKLHLILLIFVTAAPILSFVAWLLFKNNNISNSYEGLVPLAIFSFLILGFVAAFVKPLSEKGRELSDYLKGLRMYIKLAETERLKVLQSPEGAQKTKVDTGDNMELIHLYERVLPYAIIFGLEKNWNKVLGEFYERSGVQPDWYIGVGAFSVANFTSAVSSFTNYASSTNSLTGGSSGGGSSGGGGGGGGGGGW